MTEQPEGGMFHHTVSWCRGHYKQTNECPINTSTPEQPEERTTLQIVADFLASHPSKQFKVTGDEKCRALVIEKI